MAALLRDQASGSGGPGQNLVLVQSIGSPSGPAFKRWAINCNND